jgi:hypothetical protein
VLVQDPALWTSDINVESNLFTFVAAEYRDCAALLSGYVARVTFANNEIADPPNTGISMGWGCECEGRGRLKLWGLRLSSY